MTLSNKQPIYKHPLFVIHISFWVIYIASDYLVHLKYGYYDPMPSFWSGVSAYLFTSIAALITLKNKHASLRFQITVMLTVLLIASVFWHKIYMILHRLRDTTLTEEITRVLNMTILDWLETGYMPIFKFIAWGAVFIAAKLYIERRERETELDQAQLQVQSSQLEALRYQINPHFLFNTLNSIDVSVLNDDKETAHNMISHLSQLLRHNLERGEQTKIPLEQELKINADFIEIEKIRFKDGISISQQIQPAALTCMIPPLLLQPLMENAIKFAWSQQGKAKVNLDIEIINNQLVISLQNSKSDQVTTRSGTGKGLINVEKRLALLYGEDATLQIMENEDSYLVTLCLPAERMAT